MKNKTGVSVSAAAVHCGISVTAFTRLLDMGVIQRQPREVGYDLTTCRLARFKYLENLAAGRGGADGSSGAALSASRSRLAEAQTRAQEMKTAIMSGEYVRLEVFAKIHETHLMVFRERCLSIPGSCADSLTPFTPADRAAIELVLRDKVYEALDELSNPDWQAEAMDRADRAKARKEIEAA
jgi:phage terminase Nu1 subunit (DNA packaging protein)